MHTYTHTSIYLSIYLSIYQSIYLSIYLYMHTHTHTQRHAVDGGRRGSGRGGVHHLQSDLPGQDQGVHISREEDSDHLESGPFSQVRSCQGLAGWMYVCVRVCVHAYKHTLVFSYLLLDSHHAAMIGCSFRCHGQDIIY
jgi:hypothetical protein